MQTAADILTAAGIEDTSWGSIIIAAERRGFFTPRIRAEAPRLLSQIQMDAFSSGAQRAHAAEFAAAVNADNFVGAARALIGARS